MMKALNIRPVWRSLVMSACLAALTMQGIESVRAQSDDRILVRAKTIYSPGYAWGEAGEILISEGKIKFVGKQVELALSAKIIEAEVVIPGIVNAYSQAGLSGGETEFSREVTPEFNTLSTVDVHARGFREVLDEGVTTVQIVPGTENVFAGLGCILKTAVDQSLEDRVVSQASCLTLAICSDPATRNRSRTRPDSIFVRQPTNRMGVVWIARSTLNRLQQGQDVKELDGEGRQVLLDFLAGKLPAISVSRTDFDIRSALDIGAEFGFQPVIYGGDEVYRIFDEFKERGGKLVYTAMVTSATSLRGPEGTQRRLNVPGKLVENGIEFCLAGDNLLDKARFAVRFGLEPQQALAAITSLPAAMIGQSNRIGAIAVDLDADLVAFSQDPLQPGSTLNWTMVNGKIYGDSKSE